MTNNFFTYLSDLELNDDIIFHHKNLANNKQEFILPHAQYDGVSGLVKLLDEKLDITDYETSVIKPKINPPNLLSKAWMCGLYLLKDFYPKTSAFYLNKSQGSFSEDFEFFYLNESEVEYIKKQAKFKNVSVNCYLLFILNCFIRENSNLTKGVQRWMIPVSMYSHIDETKRSGNNSSFIEACISRTTSIDSLNNNIVKSLAQYKYLAPKIVESYLLKFPKFIILLIMQNHFKKNLRLGSFSNLGVWKVDKLNTDSYWGFCAPLGPNQPFTCSIITINNKMCIGMKAYAWLELKNSFKNFKENLLE
jgi:hypothetical protein